MNLFRGMLVISTLTLVNCATIVKSDRTAVQFIGGLQSGDTQVSLPDGQYTLKNGKTSVLVTRSRSDIPITVTCNNETRGGIIPTKYDALAGIAGNIIFGGIIGMGIDSVNNKAYDPPEIYNLAPLCNVGKENIAMEENTSSEVSREPSSK